MFQILIVDDEPMTLLSTAHSFQWETFGFRPPVTVGDPVAALSMLRTGRFDAAIVDIRMPGMSGIDLIRVCGEEKLSTVFIVLSGYSDFEYVQNAIRLHAFDYCLKPVLPEAADAVLSRLAPHLRFLRAQRDQDVIAGLSTFEQAKALFMASALPCPDERVTMALVQSANEAALYQASAVFKGGVSLWAQSDKLFSLFEMGENETLQALCGLNGALCCFTPPLPLEGLIPIRQFKLLDKALDGLTADQSPLLVRSSDASPAFLELLEYIDSQFTKDVSLAELANQFHLNYTYCSELFRSITGSTFTKYITDRRMRMAADLLKNTTESVNQIAQQTGYSNYNHFHQTFKNFFGKTPGAYRQGKEDK